MHAPCERHSLHCELMGTIYPEYLKVDGRGDLKWHKWLVLFSGACLCGSEASLLMHPFVNFSPVQDQLMLYLKEERFIQVTLEDHEKAVTAHLGHMKREFGPQ